MAATFDIKTGATGSKGLVIKHGTESYVLSKHGLTTEITGPLSTAKPVAPGKAATILEEALQEISKNGGKLPDNVKASLGEVLPHFHGQGVYEGLLLKVKHDVNLLNELKTAELLDAEKILVDHPHLKALLTGDESKRLTTLGVDLAGIEKKAAAAVAKAAGIEKEVGELNKLLTAEKIDEKAVGTLLTRNAHQLDLVKPSTEAIEKAAAAGIHYEGAVQTVTAEVTKHSGKVETLLGEWVEQQRIIKLDPDASKVSAAKDTAKKLEDEFKPILNSEYGNAVKGKLPNELIEKVGGHDATLGKSLGAEAAEKAGKIGGFVSKIFMRGDAAEKGLTGLKALSKTKTGLVVAGVVGAGYVAGIGRSPKGKYTDQVTEQQMNAQQSVGVA